VAQDRREDGVRQAVTPALTETAHATFFFPHIKFLFQAGEVFFIDSAGEYN